MRFLVYGLAVLVAAGLVYVLSAEPRDSASSGAAAAGVSAAGEVAEVKTAVPEGEKVPEDAQRLVLHVPEMHCPYGCYPAVEGALSQQPGVYAVELAEQKVAGELDNPRVSVMASEAFDSGAAIAALADAGFDGSKVE